MLQVGNFFSFGFCMKMETDEWVLGAKVESKDEILACTDKN